jgi:hypothetical protein
MSPDKIQFKDWVPPDAQRMWTHIRSVAQGGDWHPEALKLLQRLATWPEMKNVWEQLKYFPDVSPNDLMWVTFRVWNCATLTRDHKSKSYRTLAAGTRREINELQTTVGLAEAGITDATLNELKRVATFFERRADVFRAMRRIAEPPKKVGAHNSAEIAFLRRMCSWLGKHSGRRRPYILVANLTNVAFGVSKWDADKVKKNWLRVWSRKK